MNRNYTVALILVLIGGVLLVSSGCSNGCPNGGTGNTGGSGSGSSSGVGSNNRCSAGDGSTTPNPTIMALFYYFDSTARTIRGASLNSSGVFANLSSFTAPTLPSSDVANMAIADKKFLYVPMSGFQNIQAFFIDRISGALTTITGSPFNAQAGAESATTDPNGKFLFVGGSNASSVTVYQINSTTGALTSVPGSPFRSVNFRFANSLAVDGTGKYLYVGQVFSSIPIVGFSIDQTTGALTELSNSPFNLGVAVVRADSSGKFLLGVTNDLLAGTATDTHTSVFAIDSTSGNLTPVSGSPFATVAIPVALSVHSNGFVYSSVINSTGLAQAFEGYKLNATTGVLTALPGSPFTNFPPVIRCEFISNGTWAFCQSADGFSALGVNTTTGALSHTVTDLSAGQNLPFAVTD